LQRDGQGGVGLPIYCRYPRRPVVGPLIGGVGNLEDPFDCSSERRIERISKSGYEYEYEYEYFNSQLERIARQQRLLERSGMQVVAVTTASKEDYFHRMDT
jgi:hypothetical protein